MVVRAGAVWHAVPGALWSRRSWLAVAHLGSGALLWAGPAYLTVGVAAVAAKTYEKLDGQRHDKLYYVSAALAIVAVALLVLFALTSRFSAWQRARFRATLGVDLAPYQPAGGRGRAAAAVRAATSSRTWRQVCYHALGGVLTTACTAAVALAGAGGIALVSLPLFAKATHLALPFVLLGAAMILAVPWLARGGAFLDLALARRFLQPSGAEALAQRVESLSASRAGAVDAADAERRRIERNLHDGTQQRLVSLAMNLGMTRAALRDGPPEIRQAIADAHEEAKQALAELRHFIRGLHPAVLDELGLDAALSGLVARSPVPVRLTVELHRRPPVAVETVAYFVVSEALSNVIRHATATSADVVVRQQPARLLVSITDNGYGGADPRRGTGLRGLRQRVEAVDGTLSIRSPAGGPTCIQAALPCAS